MDPNEFPEDSDSSDEDYNPDRKPEEVVSEVDSDGDPEDPLSDSEVDTKGKRTKRQAKTRKKQKKLADFKLENESPGEKPVEVLNEKEKKEKEDALWADFMQDTGFKPKNRTETNSTSSVTSKEESSKKSSAAVKKLEEKVKVTEIFEFAGEEVRVEKEVAKDSAEARLLGSCSTSKTKPTNSGLKGIGSVLSQLGKKKKISTLEKSKLDWDKFKKDEKLEDEILTFNKGKHGYLDKQDFLERADLRRFEIEKEIRSVERSKRVTNVNP